jgi:hypothetical protein
MASLTDLFNPSFFMFLGIMVLVIALLVVYFESKIRDQNHKIASMLSLVSTLAEDINGVKMGLNHLALSSVQGGNHNIPQNTPFPIHNLGSIHNNEKSNELIEVSDDEDEENEEEEIYVSEVLEDINDIDETTSQTDDEEDDDDELLKDDNIKVIKLNISQGETYSEENAFDLDTADDLAQLDGEFEPADDIPEISEEYAEEVLSLKYDNDTKEEKSLLETEPLLKETEISESNLSQAVSELKTISINLGDEHHSEHIDFKKLQLPKLRSIAIEKSLINSSEAQKFKRQDLLKLLGAE